MFPPNEVEQATLDTLRRTVDPFGIATSLWEAEQAWLRHPTDLLDALQHLGNEWTQLQVASWRCLVGANAEDICSPVEHDPRFQDPIWRENPWLNLAKQHYLLGTHWLEDALFATPGLDDKTRRRAAFWARQWLDALAPTNFLWGNPRAMERLLATGGRSLSEGMTHWIHHLAQGDLPMVDMEAFEIGRNIASTPGQVVLRTELLELIQYTPSTERVHEIPLVIVAPWINKYYILDLDGPKSLLRWLVGQGFTVFVTSWKNPGAELRDMGFEDYLTQGVMPALEAARTICGVPQVHAVGYCIGGTLLTSLMAWLARTPEAPSPVAHWSLLATLVDFAHPGDIDLFIDEYSVAYLDRAMAKQGYLDGGELAWSFRLLRPNHLIWNYAVQHYLYGEEPPSFDVLYWNMDSTRLPARMHSYYLREMYLANKLVQPDALTLAGRPIDIGQIDAPLYCVGTEQDHIAPWQETFKTVSRVRSECRYVLATSGHILGIISPPVDPPKRRYWVGDATGERDPEAWRARVPKIPGSWWDDWQGWLAERCGPLVTPPPLGGETHPPIEPAPGSYVRER